MKSKLVLLITIALLLPATPSAYADPPPWAPAHGWRKKHDPYYIGYSGKKWGHDYGIIHGECNWETVGTVLGGVVGGAIGSAVGKDGNRAVAIIVGSVLGAVVGNQIGREIDRTDRGCIGHALELAADHHPVHWVNLNNGLRYQVTPLRGFTANNRKCREYTLDIRGEGVNESRREKACQAGDGTWKHF